MKNSNLVTVCPKELTITQGEWYYDAYAEVIENGSSTYCGILWSSDNEAIAKVNETLGFIYGRSVGTTTVYATLMDGSSCSDCITVTVVDTGEVTKILLNETEVEMTPNTEKHLRATVLPKNADNKSLSWTSDNENVATVNDGVIHAKSRGYAMIIAHAEDGSEVCRSCLVKVVDSKTSTVSHL